MKVYKKGQVVICPRCGKRGVRRLEKTCCKKAVCKVCGGSRRAHGPYWFIYHYGKDEDGTKQRRKYIGKIWPEEPSDEAINYMIKTGVATSKEEAIKLYKKSSKAFRPKR